MTDDPSFYHRSTSNPPMPMWVTGFTVDPTTGIFDFSGVPGFDLARLQSIVHVKSQKPLYARPYRIDLAEVDGTPVASQPLAESVLKVRPKMAGMSANDEYLASYDYPSSP